MKRFMFKKFNTEKNDEVASFVLLVACLACITYRGSVALYIVSMPGPQRSKLARKCVCVC